MSPASLALNRLRVMRSGMPVYDQTFHLGVNIIRGENGSGKSTIADFIFYALGGEFDNWKTYAKLCDEVQAELLLRGGTVTVRRVVGQKLTPLQIFFGPMVDAEQHGLDSWSHTPVRRSGSQESFSQIIFRAAGLPEAQNIGGSNITMHQILRLLYSDQKTPAPRLFRLELFDNRDIREAVGGFLCGLDVYEGYEIQLQLRDLDKAYTEKSQELALKIAAVPTGAGSITFPALSAQMRAIEAEREKIKAEIETADQLVNADETADYAKQRTAALRKIRTLKSKIAEREGAIETLSLDLEDLAAYLAYLGNTARRLPGAERTAQVIGNIEFTHCPSCLRALDPIADKSICVVCGGASDPEREQSRYLQIKLDLEIQMRESQQLEEEKQLEKSKGQAELRELQRSLDTMVSDFTVRFDLSTSPRESFLATRNQRLGRMESELQTLARYLDIARDIEILSEQKAKIQHDIDLLKTRQQALEVQRRKRTMSAMTLISQLGVALLADDLPRQKEFASAQQMSVNFGDDVVMVDGEANFAESSNVILKNTAILSLFSAATLDSEFFHPRFLLLDNVEDKGMEEARSHNFQKLIVERSQAAKIPHQIIFTTSTINPALELSEFVIGPHYTHENKTLAIS